MGLGVRPEQHGGGGRDVAEQAARRTERWRRAGSGTTVEQYGEKEAHECVPIQRCMSRNCGVRVELEAQYRAVDISNANSKNIQTGDIRCPQYQYSNSSLQYLHPNTTFLLKKKRSMCIGINSSRNREETNKMKKVTLKI